MKKVFKPDIRFCFFKTYNEYEKFRNNLEIGECMRLPNMQPFTEALRRLAGVSNVDYQSVVAVNSEKAAGLVLEDEIEFWFISSWEEAGEIQKRGKGIMLIEIHPFSEWLRHKAGVTNKEYTFILAVKGEKQWEKWKKRR